MSVYYDHDADTNLSKDSATARQFTIGAVCAIAAVAIWAGWLVMTRLGITTTLTASDLTALRFAVAGVVLLPVVLRRGLAFSRLGWPGFMAVVIGAGFPVPLLVGAGGTGWDGYSAKWLPFRVLHEPKLRSLHGGSRALAPVAPGH